MAIDAAPVNTWIQHLPFIGQRPTVYGPADGLFVGLVGAVGDGSGGGVALRGQLSNARKEDWVYLVRHWSAQTDFLASALDIRISINTGPVVPNPTARQFAQFTGIDELNTFAGIGMASAYRTTQNPFQPADLFVFGDKKLAGDFTLIQANFQTNTDAIDYTLQVSGLIFRYASFFRSVAPSRA